MKVPAALSEHHTKLKAKAEALQILMLWTDLEADAGNPAPALALQLLFGKPTDAPAAAPAKKA